METENLTPQASLKPTPPVIHFSKVAVIFGIALVSAFVVGAVFYFKNSKSTHIVVYGELNRVMPEHEIVFYSVNYDTKEKKQLFVVPEEVRFGNENGGLVTESISNQGMWDFKFCPATNKIYFRQFATNGMDMPIKELDFTGKIRDLNFTGTESPDYQNLVRLNTGFVISKDCQKIVWSTAYYKTDYDYTGDGYVGYELVFSDINGGGKKVLQTIKRTPDNALSKRPISWSTTDPNVVYLTNYDWIGKHIDGGLFKLELNTNLVTQIETIPSKNIVWDISNKGNLIAHQPDVGAEEKDSYKSFVTDLTNKSTLPLLITTYSKRKFSPDNTKLASNDGYCSDKCYLNLSVFNLIKNNKLAAPDYEVKDWGISLLKPTRMIAPDIELWDWITNDSVVGVKYNKKILSREGSLKESYTAISDIVIVNVNNGKETKITPVSGELFFAGVSDK